MKKQNRAPEHMPVEEPPELTPEEDADLSAVSMRVAAEMAKRDADLDERAGLMADILGGLAGSYEEAAVALWPTDKADEST